MSNLKWIGHVVEATEKKKHLFVITPNTIVALSDLVVSKIIRHTMRLQDISLSFKVTLRSHVKWGVCTWM